MHEMNVVIHGFPENEERCFREEYFQQSIKLVRVASLLGFFLYLAFGILDYLVIQAEFLPKVWAIRFGVLCPSALALYFFTYSAVFKRFMQLSMSLVLLIGGLGIVAMTAIAPPPGNYLYYGGLTLIIMFIHTFSRLRFLYATYTSLTVVVAYEIVAILSGTPWEMLLSNNFFFLSANVIGMFSSYLMEYYNRRDFVQRQSLKLEEEKSKELLLNILPKGIVDRLKHSQGELKIEFSQIIVDKFDDVSILFADIVEFTDLSSRISPQALVVFLSELFSIFDGLAEKHRLEKIKTIGDAYMAVGGLPDPLPRHAQAVAEMALDMEEEVAKMDAAKEGWLRIRIGIHTGSVVAGVIGRKKFSYDLWGNAVNIASRMERYSVAGNILVSEETYLRLRDEYEFVERGNIEVKGKGDMKTYFLAGRKPSKRDPIQESSPSQELESTTH